MKQGVRYFKSLRVLSLVFSLMTLCAGMAFGQAISGNLVGTVTDPMTSRRERKTGITIGTPCSVGST